MSQRTISINYKASPTLAKFHKSNKFHRLVRGPVGSGKSTGMCVEIFRRACEQSPQQDGIRRTRFAIVRSTYRELQDTTLKTWLDWFPEDLGQSRLNRSEMTHQLRFNDVECEVMFRALDRPDDVKKLLSLELTGAWINEARETPKAIVDAMGDRVGRYPSVKDGGCTWRGILLDTNPPDDDHWLYRLAEVDRPDNWGFFVQPGGLIESSDGIFASNPDAENLDNIEPGYYLTRMSGKNPEHIRVYYCNQYGFVRDGKPVYPEYVDAVHCASDLIAVNPSQPLYIGIDFGLTPAAAFGQRDVFGRISLIDELVTEDMGAVRFGELLRAKLQSDYYEFLSRPRDIILHGDPAGDQRAQTDEATPFMILNNILSDLNLTVIPAHTNDPVIRREAVAVPLSRLVDGRPGMMISPKCAVLRKGLAGGYSYKRLNVAGDERYQDKPDKGKYSHVCDAHQYMCLAMGEGRALTVQPVKPYVRQPRPRAREF